MLILQGSICDLRCSRQRRNHRITIIGIAVKARYGMSLLWEHCKVRKWKFHAQDMLGASCENNFRPKLLDQLLMGIMSPQRSPSWIIICEPWRMNSRRASVTCRKRDGDRREIIARCNLRLIDFWSSKGGYMTERNYAKKKRERT